MFGTLGIPEWILLVALVGIASGWIAAFLLKGLFQIHAAVKWLFGFIPTVITLLIYIAVARESDYTFSAAAWMGASLMFTVIFMYLLAKLRLLPGVKPRKKKEEYILKKPDIR